MGRYDVVTHVDHSFSESTHLGEVPTDRTKTYKISCSGHEGSDAGRQLEKIRLTHIKAGLNPYVFPLEILIMKGKKFVLAPLYVSSLYAWMD